MKQPWEILYGQYRDHWMLAEFLDGDVPRISDIRSDDRWWSLSSGEQAMVAAGEAMLRLNECWLAVDEDNRHRIDAALRLALDV